MPIASVANALSGVTTVLAVTTTVRKVLIVVKGPASAMNNVPTARFTVGPSDDPDKYSLRRMVGSGGEAQLWQADLVVAGNLVPVAVKILHPARGDEFDEFARRWSEQVELLRFVRHPGVVGVREHFVSAPMHGPGDAASDEHPDLYLIMNWVEGRSLRDWSALRGGPQVTLDGIRYLEQVAAALDLLHSGRATSGRPVVHGDLSPGNVMIDAYGQAILVDFGLIRVRSHRTSHPMGTLGFAAPETLRSGEYSPAADRFGFGALAYFALTGAAPADGPEQLLAGLQSVPLLAGRSPGKLRELLDIFDDIPDRRPASAQQWIHALRDTATTTLPPAQHGTSSAFPSPAVPTYPSTSPGRSNPRSTSVGRTAAAGAAALVVVLLLLIWQPWAGGASPGTTPTPTGSADAGPTSTPTDSADAGPTSTTNPTTPPLTSFVSRYAPKPLTIALGTCGRNPPKVDLSVPRTSSDGQSDFVYYRCAGPAAVRYSTREVDVAVLASGGQPTAEACNSAVDTSLLSDNDLVVRGGEVVCFRRTAYLVEREGVEPLIAAVTIDRVTEESLSVTAHAWNVSE